MSKKLFLLLLFLISRQVFGADVPSQEIDGFRVCLLDSGGHVILHKVQCFNALGDLVFIDISDLLIRKSPVLNTALEWAERYAEDKSFIKLDSVNAESLILLDKLIKSEMLYQDILVVGEVISLIMLIDYLQLDRIEMKFDKAIERFIVLFNELEKDEQIRLARQMPHDLQKTLLYKYLKEHRLKDLLDHNLVDYQIFKGLIGSNRRVTSMDISQDNKYLVASYGLGWDNEIEIKAWDVQTGQLIDQFVFKNRYMHESGYDYKEIKRILISADNQFVIMHSKYELFIYNLKEKVLFCIFPAGLSIFSMEMSYDNESVVIVKSNFEVVFVRLKTGCVIKKYDILLALDSVHKYTANLILSKLSTNKGFVVTGNTYPLKLWDVESGCEIKSISLGVGCYRNNPIMLSCDNRFMVVDSIYGGTFNEACQMIEIIDMVTNKKISEFKLDILENIDALKMSCNNKFLVLAGKMGVGNNIVKIRDLITGRLIKVLELAPSPEISDNRQVAISNDEKFIVVDAGVQNYGEGLARFNLLQIWSLRELDVVKEDPLSVLEQINIGRIRSMFKKLLVL